MKIKCFRSIPDPVSYKYASVISPVINGVIVNVPPVVFAYETFTSTSMGGYWKIWYPPCKLRASVVNPTISTYFFLIIFSVTVPPIPTSMSLNLSSLSL